MKVTARLVTLHLRRTFAISRSAVEQEMVLVVSVEHDGLVGTGEGAPGGSGGETPESMLAFVTSPQVLAALGDDPFGLEEIGDRLAAFGGNSGARMALDGALHDWVGRRLDQPVWRLLGFSATLPVTSFTIGIDTVAGTIDRVREATGFEVLKIKVGGPDDLARLRAIRSVTDVRLRVDGNEGWTLDTAGEMMPALVELGVEFVEQPFPAGDPAPYLALRELPIRIPVVIDEGCRDSRQVAEVAGYADGVNLKLAKTGGIREALRAVHVARALGLQVMLGCMIESQLGIAQAAQLGSLADYLDLDGHLLISNSEFCGLGLRDGRLVLSDAPGLGVA